MSDHVSELKGDWQT